MELARQISHFILTLEAIVLIFLTVLGGVFVISGMPMVWMAAWTEGDWLGALIWLAVAFSLVSAWWLLLAYFYLGHRGARRVPAFVWWFAALASALAVLGALLDGPHVAVLFVPTFIHLSAEVWIWPPRTARDLAPGG